MNWQLQKRTTTTHLSGKTQVNEQVRVIYKGVTLAIFQDVKTDMMEEARKYILVYGYMGEYRKRWLVDGFCNWSEDLRVGDFNYEVLEPIHIER